MSLDRADCFCGVSNWFTGKDMRECRDRRLSRGRRGLGGVDADGGGRRDMDLRVRSTRVNLLVFGWSSGSGYWSGLVSVGGEGEGEEGKGEIWTVGDGGIESSSS